MKIKYIFVCLLASMGIVNAQYQNFNITTTNDDADSKSYIGRDYVRLQNGYSFSAIKSGKTLNAKVQSGLTTTEAKALLAIANPTNNANITPETLTAINTGAAVGQIPISSSVSPSGAKCYNVPIEIVQGRLGFQPNISLSYNSQAGNGVVGMGWNISGLSSIERVNKNMFYDGKNEVPDLTDNDVFTLDGVRLVIVPYTGPNPEAEKYYETVQGNIKVNAYFDGSIIKYFIVQYPNGTVGVFGNTDNTTSKLSYPITSLTDMNGSTITFSYDTTDNVDLNAGTTNEVYYIKEINYGQCGSVPNFAKIKFSYDAIRPDQTFSLVSSKSCVLRKRLIKIESFANPDLIRTYSLNYSNVDPRLPSNTNDISRLNQIGCSASAESLNPLNFYYGETGTLTTSVQPTALTSSNFDLKKATVIRGKFDVNSQNDALLVFDKSSFQTGSADEGIKVYQNLSSTSSTPKIIGSGGISFEDVFAANIDGVRNDEVVKINSAISINNKETLKFTIYTPDNILGLKSIGTIPYDISATSVSVTRYVEVEPQPRIEYIKTDKKYYTGNFTGNGKTEVLVIPQYMDDIPILVEYVMNENNNNTYLFDLDNNTASCLFTGVTFVNTGNELVYPLDIDGDGQTEIVHITTANTKVYKYKSGNGFVNVSTWALTKSDFDNRQILFSDLNGDDKTDIVMSPKEPVEYHHTYTDVEVCKFTICPNCGAKCDKKLFVDDNVGHIHVSMPVYGISNVCTISCNECCHMFSYILDPTDHGTCGVNNCTQYLTNTQKVGWNVFRTRKSIESFACPIHGFLVNLDYYFLSPVRDKIWKYLFSDGINTPIIKTKEFAIGREFNHRYSIQDIDGDNTPELIVNIDGQVSFYPYRDKDHAFDNTSIVTAIIPKNSEIGSLDIQSEFVNNDLNNDKSNTQLFAINTNRIDRISFSQNRAKNNQISLMINSLGIADKTNYDQLYQGKNYTPGTAATFPNTDFQGPMWVATQNSVMYNKQLISNTTYNYTGAILHKQGLGLRGFTSIKATGLMTNKMSTTEFEPYKMGAIKKQTSDTEESTFDYTFTDYSNATDGNKKMKLLLNYKTVTDNLKKNTVTTTYSGYDNYGNVGTEVSTFVDNNTTVTNNIKTTVTNTYKNKLDAIDIIGALYVIGLPSTTSTTFERDNKTFTQSASYTYNIFWRPEYYRKYIGDTKLSETQYFYYDYPFHFMVKDETVHNVISNKGVEDDLTTSYTYDVDKCSLKTKKDPMGLVTSYSYYPSTRLLKDVTDYLDNKVTYVYDKWRRKNSEVSKAGTEEITSMFNLIWNPESEPKRLIQQTTTTTGQPAVTTYADAFGRETRKAIAGFTTGTNVFSDKEYDNFGHLQSSSAPYNSTESPLWTTYNYDQYDRSTKVLQPNGSTTTYAYEGNKISENKDGVSTSKTTDATGKTTATTDAGGTVNYIYRADGQPESVNAAGVVTSFEYDDYGRQNKLIDPSAGTVQTDYKDAIHTITQTMNSGKIITTVTNKYGQPITKTTPDFTTTYSYDPTYKRPTGSTTTNGTSKGVEYDTYGRLWKSTETVSGKTYQEVYGYDNGRIGSVTYNTGSGTSLTKLTSLIYKYNGNGYLYRLEDAAGNRLREVNSVNAQGQETAILLGNGLTTTKSYTPEGLWTNVNTANANGSNVVQNMNFNFNRINGTLNSRTDVTRGLSESFAYDGLYRLRSFGSKTMDYNPNGNINTKSDVGAASIYKYNDDTNTKPYTLFKIYNATTVDLASQLDIDYTVMSHPTSIRNTTGLSAAFTYNDSYDRATMQVKQGSIVTMNKTYFGGGKYEIETVGGIEKQRLYVDGSPYTASVLLEKTGASAIQTYFLHREYLGSITQISNNSGTLAAEYSYDAWGRMRDITNWQVYPATAQPTLLFGRGYTGHEHMNQFGIINMNARLYDPVLARFLAPDPFVGSGLTNDFNRYIYCRNNPLMFTDPSGEFSFEIGWGSKRGFFYRATNGNSGFSGSYNTSSGTFTAGSTYYGYQTGAVIYQQSQYNQKNSLSHVLIGHNYTNYTTAWMANSNTIRVNLESTRHDVYADYSFNGKYNGTEGGNTNWGLAALTVEDVYNNYIHNHTTYETTKGIVKNIYTANGAVRSERALQFARLSTAVKVLGDVGGAISTANAVINISNNKGNGILNWGDFLVGSSGLTNSAVGYLGGSSVPLVGQAVAFYSWERFWGDMGYNYGPSHWYGEDDTKWFK